MNRDEIPRSPSHYQPTSHCVQQSRYRGIEYSIIAETIQDGTIKNSHKENCCLFINDFHFADDPVAVVVNYVDGAILTVEWRQ
jgi:hypothetical protein